MCILFMHVNPEPKEGEYRLIIATNRDEHYGRPASDVSWCDEGILGGRDMEPGREGGMWFGFATKEGTEKEGKKYCTGTLLNLTGEKTENANGRGGIVKNYLKTPLGFSDYTSELDKDHFSGYNLVAVELSKTNAKTFHHSNNPNISSVYSGKQTLSFGNSPINQPLSKVTVGRKKFEEIIFKSLEVDELVEELLKLLKDETRCLPDNQLEKRSPLAYEFLSSIFVKIGGQHGYGTRAHTIVLIDHNWNLHFVEHALKQPIDVENFAWNVNHIQSRL